MVIMLDRDGTGSLEVCLPPRRIKCEVSRTVIAKVLAGSVWFLICTSLFGGLSSYHAELIGDLMAVYVASDLVVFFL